MVLTVKNSVSPLVVLLSPLAHLIHYLAHQSVLCGRQGARRQTNVPRERGAQNLRQTRRHVPSAARGRARTAVCAPHGRAVRFVWVRDGGGAIITRTLIPAIMATPKIAMYCQSRSTHAPTANILFRFENLKYFSLTCSRKI